MKVVNQLALKQGDDPGGPRESGLCLEEEEGIRRESQRDGSEGRAQQKMLALKREEGATGQGWGWPLEAATGKGMASA